VVVSGCTTILRHESGLGERPAFAMWTMISELTAEEKIRVDPTNRPKVEGAKPNKENCAV